MAKASPAQTSFAGGELSPLLEGRIDLAKYPIGCRKLRNFMPLIQGPARKRGGTRFIAEVKDSTAYTWLQSFVFSQTDSAIIEYGNLYNRFFRNRNTANVAGADAYNSGTTYALSDFVTYSGTQYRSLQAANLNNQPDISPTFWVAQDAYENVSPYSAANLINDEGGFGLSIAQSADVMYIAQGDVGPKTLSRFSSTHWVYATYQPEDGPFDPQNIDKTISVHVSGETGTVTFTNDAADSPVPSGTTSRLIRIEETDKSAVDPWEANKRIAGEGENPFGQERRSDGHLYDCATNSTVAGGQIEYRTGSVKPIHTEGTESDGDGKPLYSGSTLFAGKVGVAWTYLHSGYGIGRITAVAGGGLTATLVINSDFRMPASVVSPGSYRWSLGAWYAGHFPTAVAFYRDRLCWSGGQRVQLTVAGGYTSMAGDEFGEVLPDSAIDVLISIGSMDQVNWIATQPNALLIGTSGSTLAFEEITHNAVLGPANSKFEPQSAIGTRKIMPINVDDCTLFIERSGLQLREAQYSADTERFSSRDLTAFSEHITQSGIIAMAFAANPNNLMWCLRADGKLACLTYEKNEDVIAWSLHDVGGVVESIAVIPSPYAGIDDLYMIVRRTINGTVKRYIEVLLPPYTAPNDPWTYSYQDCSLSYDGTQSVTLALGTGYGTVGASVTATAGSATFSSGDIDREIRVRTYDSDTELWSTAIGVITGYTSTTVVTIEIVSAFATNNYAAGAWGLTAHILSGFGHLEGETVRIVADGATHVDRVVSGGSVTLTRQALYAHVGKAMKGVIQLMNLEAGGEDGTAQGKIKKISTITFRLFETMGGQCGPNLIQLDSLFDRDPSTPMNQGDPLFSGDKSIPWPNGYETEGRITFVHDVGLPATLCAVFPQVHVEPNRTGSTYSK